MEYSIKILYYFQHDFQHFLSTHIYFVAHLLPATSHHTHTHTHTQWSVERMPYIFRFVRVHTNEFIINVRHALSIIIYSPTSSSCVFSMCVLFGDEKTTHKKGEHREREQLKNRINQNECVSFLAEWF